jgi:hypothetical protein
MPPRRGGLTYVIDFSYGTLAITFGPLGNFWNKKLVA